MAPFWNPNPTASGRSMGIENRRHSRHDIVLEVRIETGAGPAVTCWLADVSQSGARLAVGSAAKLPDEFTLALSADMRRRCHVVWRNGQEVGVKFVTEAPAVDAWGRVMASRKREPLRFAVIKCRQTGRPIETDIRVRNAEELAKLEPVRRFAQCPHCQLAHGWVLADAWVPEQAAP
jgi:hypothetical protein